MARIIYKFFDSKTKISFVLNLDVTQLFIKKGYSKVRSKAKRSLFWLKMKNPGYRIDFVFDPEKTL